MKILLLNPHIDAQHKIAQLLKARGMALLICTTADEAWQVLKLHGTSVDLAIIHREGATGGDPGVELLSKIKKDPSQEDLPVIFSSEVWTPAQFAGHQQTPLGANAYMGWPCDANAFAQVIESVVGTPEGASAAQPPFPNTGTNILPEISPKAAARAGAPPAPKTGEVVLTDDPSKSFVTRDAQSQSSIKLDAPEGSDAATTDPIVAVPIGPDAGEASQLDISDVSKVSPSLDLSGVEAVGAPAGESIALSSIDISVQTEAVPSSAAAVSSPSLSISAAAVAPDAPADAEAEREMPYLFSKKEGTLGAPLDPAVFARAFAQPVGDSVVPGGAAQAPDTETLKKYLLLREQDVAILSGQLKAANDDLGQVKAQLHEERSRAEELSFTVAEQKRKIEDFEREKALSLEGLQAELTELRFQNKVKVDKAKTLEAQVNEATAEIERLKIRVRGDIRKIRVRERELENRLEMSKKDSEAILLSRENKIIELKRKLDLLEFNLDLLQDRHSREKESSSKLREKLAKAAQVVRVAEGLLDEPLSPPQPPEKAEAS